MPGNVSELNLQSTGNLLTVEIHQGRSNSSDIHFGIEEMTPFSSEEENPNVQIKNLSLEIGPDKTHTEIPTALGRSGHGVSPRKSVFMKEILRGQRNYAIISNSVSNKILFII